MLFYEITGRGNMTRRIVTAHDTHGKSIILDQLSSPKTAVFRHIKGFEVSTVWATPATPRIANSVEDPVSNLKSVLPQIGGTVLLKVTFPPDSVMAEVTDWAAAGAEQAANLPGLAEKFEPDSPGMHTTDSVDYGIMLDGELWVEVDGGEARQVRAGDIVIQNGTRHAWRNRTQSPATIAFVLIGATRG
jgi:quercetin dioxygenase-like cupin family protein